MIVLQFLVFDITPYNPRLQVHKLRKTFGCSMFTLLETTIGLGSTIHFIQVKVTLKDYTSYFVE